jgi:heptosyltransferase III
MIDRGLVKAIHLALAMLMVPIIRLCALLYNFRRRGRVEAPVSVLVIKLDGVGDTVLALPALKAIRRCLPNERLAAIVRRETGVLLDRIGYDELHIAPTYSGPFRFLSSFWWTLCYGKASSLRGRCHTAVILRYDVDFYGATFLAVLLGCKRVIGFSESVSSLKRFYNYSYDSLLTDRIFETVAPHELLRCLELVRASGLSSECQSIDLHVDVTESDIREVDSFLTDQLCSRGSTIGLAIGSAEERKRWPIQKYAELGRALVGRGWSVVVVGGEKETLFGKTIAREVQGAIDATGCRNIMTSIALLSRCTALVSNDTGPAHLAAVAGIPVVVIGIAAFDDLRVEHDRFSPTRFSPWTETVVVAPRQLLDPCRGWCRARTAHCIGTVEVDDVLSAVSAIIG